MTWTEQVGAQWVCVSCGASYQSRPTDACNEEKHARHYEKLLARQRKTYRGRDPYTKPRSEDSDGR